MIQYINYYYCHDCNQSWECQECDSMHNDKCVFCNKEIQPEKSELFSDSVLLDIILH